MFRIVFVKFFWITALISAVLTIETLAQAQQKKETNPAILTSVPKNSEKRERSFFGDGGFSLGFSKYSTEFPFGGGGIGGFYGSGLGHYQHHHHHQQHGFGYNNGFQTGFGHYGGYNPYFYNAPTIAGGFGGGSFGFKQNYHHGFHPYPLRYPGYGFGGVGFHR